MVKGLMSGLQAGGIGASAFGQSVATGGREGGSPAVIAAEGEIQRQKIAAQTAATNTKNAALQQQLMQSDINISQFTAAKLGATYNDDLTTSHMKAREETQLATSAEQEADSKAQEDFDQRAFLRAGYEADPITGQVRRQGQSPMSAGGASPAGSVAPAAGAPTATPGQTLVGVTPPASAGAPASTPTVTPGKTLVGVTPAASATAGTPAAAPAGTPAAGTQASPYQNRLNMRLDASDAELKDAQGNSDPLVKGARDIISNPASTPLEKQRAILAVEAKSGLSKTVIADLTAKADLQTKQQSADPLYKLETDPSQMAGPKASAAIPMLQNMLSTETDPAKKIRETHLLAQATSAHNAFQADQKSAEAARIAASAGDPVANGEALATGQVTLADLKSRGSTPGNITASVNAATDYATKHGFKYNASDEVVGEQSLKVSVS